MDKMSSTMISLEQFQVFRQGSTLPRMRHEADGLAAAKRQLSMQLRDDQ